MNDIAKAMTIEKAIAILKNGVNAKTWEEQTEAKTLGIYALEKQIPKKPINQATDEKTHYKCECGSIHLTVYKKDGLHMGHKAKFCEWCGQAIDWEAKDA